uniref:non-specific serine/threonine protein kinase n=1 Tax=Parascaris equorum TaxID=6256 RepID=A0A914RLU4_PAREQ
MVQSIRLCFKTETAVSPHCIVILPNSNGMQLLLCYNNEGVYVSTYGKATKNVFLQWGETPSSVGEFPFRSSGRIKFLSCFVLSKQFILACC